MDLGGSGVGQIAVHPVLVKKVNYFSPRQYHELSDAKSVISYHFRVQLQLHYMALGTLEMSDWTECFRCLSILLVWFGAFYRAIFFCIFVHLQRSHPFMISYSVSQHFRHHIQYNGCDLKVKRVYQYLTGSISWYFIRTGMHFTNLFQSLILHAGKQFTSEVLNTYRIKTNPKSAINEHFLPRFLDFVVWGHEHECLIDPQVIIWDFFLKLIFFQGGNLLCWLLINCL